MTITSASGARLPAIRTLVVRLALTALLALQPVVQAAELAPVDILLTRAIPQDEAALATAGPEKGERLVILQSDLALVVEGLEGFASEADAAPSLKRLQESVDAPEQFKDRASALDAVYRALAVVDYTWAKRLPEAPCSPDASRAALLKSGALSYWISSLLGVESDAAAALDRASAATKASAREYALLRAKVRRLSEALGSEKAVGAMRASLYCRRAGAYEALSAANRTSGLTAASRATGEEDITGVYVLARPSASGWEILGAATSIDGAIVTDARLADSDGLALLRRDGKKPIPVTVERRDSGLALLRAAEPVKGLALAENAPAKDDLIETLGHPERTGAWTRTRGLVTSADAFSFQSDAVVDVGMAGGAALTEDGKLAGVFVLRRARSGDQTFDWPVAVSAPALKSWIAGGALAAPSGSVEIAEAGTASILTASRPLLDSLQPGLNAIAASDEFTYQGIRFVCKANCDDPAPAPAPRARSRTRYTNPRSSYGSSSNANAELGKALGEAVAPLVEAMIFKGIPALFRGIGSLFKSKPSATTPHREIAQERPREIEKPPEPPKIAGLTLSLDRSTALEGERVTAAALVAFTDSSAKKDGIVVSFSVDPTAKVTIADGAKGNSRPTDATGRATITYEINAVEKERQQPFDELKEEERRRAVEEPISRVRPQRKAKSEYDRVKAKMSDRFKGLDDEAAKFEDGEALADQSQDEYDTSPDPLTQAALLTGPAPIRMETLYSLVIKARAETGGRSVAPGAKLDDDEEAKVQSGDCPAGMVAVMSAPEPPGGSPGSPAQIDPLKAKQLLECKEIEDRILAKCADDLACEARELKQERYFEQGCESRWRKLGGASPGSIGVPNIARRSGDYWCLPAKPRTKKGAQIYTQGTGAGASEDEDDQGNRPSRPTTELVERILSILKPNGRWIGEKVRDVIRVRGTLEDAKKLFERLTQGMKAGPHPNPKIGATGRQANHGEITIGLRPVSQSGPPTVDVTMPGKNPIEVKFVP